MIDHFDSLEVLYLVLSIHLIIKILQIFWFSSHSSLMRQSKISLNIVTVISTIGGVICFILYRFRFIEVQQSR